MKLVSIFYTLIFTSLSETASVENPQFVDEISNEISGEVVPKYNLKRARPRPPQYLSYVMEQLEGSNDNKRGGNRGVKHFRVQDRTFKKPTKRLFYAWLPTEMNDISDRTTVTFQQTRSNREFGHFTNVQVTLTLREDIEDQELPSNPFVSMFAHWDESDMQKDLTQSQPIKLSKKFYSFNITQFVSYSLRQNLSHPFLLNISFHVGKTEFSKVFDVQVDLPMILFYYNDNVPEYDIKKSRQRRSKTPARDVLASRPTTQCQRRELLVTPEELLLPSILQPAKLDLGFCSGSCQYPLQDSYYNYTIHAFLLSRFRLGRVFNYPTGFPTSNCVPTSYKPLDLLEEIAPDYYVSETVENISVEHCGCS